MQTTDFDKVPKREAEPKAASMIETFRAIGYNIQTAIADLIDNSISAQANTVWVNFYWQGSKSIISIRDNGIGMDEDQLVDAMRPGSKSPIEERDPKDLGRFGLGLKTASFSQCRKFTLVSKTSQSAISFWSWDLDYVNLSKKWELIKTPLESKIIKELEAQKSGTIVIWENIDKLFSALSQQSESDYHKFLEYKEIVDEHLSMVFHRYIESKKVRIFSNEVELLPWSPFMKGENALQTFPEISIEGGTISVQPYILPHHSKLSKTKIKEGEGINGWTAHQGFYVYRNERMVVPATWFGMFRKEEHFKLVRIQIDLPNAVDLDWQVDIKKSVARPPAHIKDQLRTIAMSVRNASAEIYKHRGRKLVSSSFSDFEFLWEERKRQSKKFFKINPEHSLVKAAIDSSNDKKVIRALIKMLEETIPIPQITINESETAGVHALPFENEEENVISELLHVSFKSLITQGLNVTQAKKRLMQMPPLNDYPHLIDVLK